MSILHQIDPVAIDLGPVAIHWYGVTYLVGFALFWWLARLRIARQLAPISAIQLDDLMFYGVLGVIVGGRLGYLLFYVPAEFFADPLMALRIQQGGMSFHGGLLGVLMTTSWFAYRHRLHLFDIFDFLAPLVPPGLACGRIGNYIGGELWGRVTDVPWAVVFPRAIDPLAIPPGADLIALHAQGALERYARHPSQLYQAFGEGLCLFLLVWFLTNRKRPRYFASGLFLVGYAVARSAAEMLREPDAHLGFIALGWLTMGQLLCAPMLVAGVYLLWLSQRPVVERGA